MQKTGVFLFMNHSSLIVLIMEITGCHTAWEQDQSLCTVNCTCHSTDTDARSDNFKHEQISKNKIRSCLYSYINAEKLCISITICFILNLNIELHFYICNVWVPSPGSIPSFFLMFSTISASCLFPVAIRDFSWWRFFILLSTLDMMVSWASFSCWWFPSNSIWLSNNFWTVSEVKECSNSCPFW